MSPCCVCIFGRFMYHHLITWQILPTRVYSIAFSTCPLTYPALFIHSTFLFYGVLLAKGLAAPIFSNTSTPISLSANKLMALLKVHLYTTTHLCRLRAAWKSVMQEQDMQTTKKAHTTYTHPHAGLNSYYCHASRIAMRG